MFPFSFKNSSQMPHGGVMANYGALLQRLLPALRRRNSFGTALEHLGTMPLTAQSSLALVRLQGETLLLGITPQNITLLAKGKEGAALVGAAGADAAQEPFAS